MRCATPVLGRTRSHLLTLTAATASTIDSEPIDAQDAPPSCDMQCVPPEALRDEGNGPKGTQTGFEPGTSSMINQSPLSLERRALAYYPDMGRVAVSPKDA